MLLLKIGLIVAASCYVNGQSCSSSTNCVPIMQCPELLSLISKPNRTPQDLMKLKNSQCGFDGTSPKVCCPASSPPAEQCYTPDGKPGQCISIYQCPHVASLLKLPYSRPDNVNYVLNSKCVGPDKYSVCCGPPRSLAETLNTKCAGAITAFPPNPDTNCCGSDANVGNKITGGNVTTVDQYPWLTLIEYTKAANGPIKTLCGGALISGRYVLTAAHCVTGTILNFGTPRNVRLGEYDTANSGADCAPADGGGIDCNDGTVVIPIEQSTHHPDYQARNSQNDIALIRLKQSAPFTDFIRPICLPTSDVTGGNPASLTLFAAGWGAVSEVQPNSAVKLYVDLPFVARDVCQQAYRVPGRMANLWEGQICAGGVPGKDSCKGDSGGPLMYENSAVRRHEVVGVVSFGPTPCGLPDIPGVYSRVFFYLAWIKSVIKA